MNFTAFLARLAVFDTQRMQKSVTNARELFSIYLFIISLNSRPLINRIFQRD